MTTSLTDKLKEFNHKDAIIWNGKIFSFSDLLSLKEQAKRGLSGVQSGACVSLEADFSPMAIATLLHLIENEAIVVPLSKNLPSEVVKNHLDLAHAGLRIRIENEKLQTEKANARETPALYQELHSRAHPGLILFSSGSTGAPKAAVHDFTTLLEKFKTPRPPLRMISFMLWDHIGGINTLFHSLSNGGCIVVADKREPQAIFQLIEKFKIELLPTTPTFLRFLLLSHAWEKYDISSLKTISYGSEPMPESTLQTLRTYFPQIKLVQTYGLTEIGIMRAKSRSSDSLWVKVGGKGYETRVVEGLLEIKAHSSMLGYLNAPSPFTPDGWFKTNDIVEQDGEWLKILGRASEVINVGGEKVFPAEVESVLLKMPNVVQVNVSAQTNPLLGQVVKAEVQLQTEESLFDFQARMRAFCSQHLEKYKIPQTVTLNVFK